MSYKIILLCLFVSVISFSQEIIFRDIETKMIVENVSIRINDKTFEAKEFSLKTLKLSDSDTLFFSHIAYEPDFKLVSEIKLNNQVYLKPKLLKTNEVLIREKRLELKKTEIGNLYNLDSINKSIFLDFSDFIKKNTYLYLRSYGGSNSLQTFSARGLPGVNLEVLFNEFKVNDIATGTFDFSNINYNVLNRLKYSKSFDLNTGIISSGGVINIYTDVFPENYSFTIGTRLDNIYSKSIYTNLSSPYQKISYKIDFDYSQSENNYTYIFNDLKLKRNNADYKKFTINSLLKVDFLWDNEFYFTYKKFESGIPGFVVENNFNSSSARSNYDYYFIAYKLSKYLLNTLKIKLSGSYTSQEYTLKDPFKELIFEKNLKLSKLNSYGLTFSSEYLINNFRINSGYGLVINDFIEDTDTNEKLKRTQNEFFISIDFPFFNEFLILKDSYISGILRNKLLSTENNVYNDYSIAFSTKIKNLEELTLQFNYSFNNRIITFNELYYSKLISKNELKPEKFNSLDFNINYQNPKFNDLNINFSLFEIIGKDKIIWIPTRLAFQTPINISKINSKGFEISIYQSFLNNFFNYAILYSYNDVRNKSALSENDLTYNKQLVYSPKHKLNVNLSLNIYEFNLFLNSSYYSETYFTDDNYYKNKLNAYYLIDVSLSYNYSLFNMKHKIVFTIFNLLNKDYMIIQSYPMPLRTFMMNYEIKIL